MTKQVIQICKRIFFLVEDETGKPMNQIVQDYELVESLSLTVSEILVLTTQDGSHQNIRVVETGELIRLSDTHYECKVRVRHIDAYMF
jgi:hypothetical protein